MAYSPAPIRRESVISQAAQEICRVFEAERLSAGEALPPETRLSELLGISRNSVREALRVLHGLGYVEKAAGRRVVVTRCRARRQEHVRRKRAARSGSDRECRALAYCADMRRTYRRASHGRRDD